MIKMVTLLTRRPDISREEFQQRYENGHRLIGEKYLRGYAERYVRRYCRPATGAPKAGELPCDVVLEIWFPDQATFDAAMVALSEPEAAAEIAADEARLFDRDKIVSFMVDEFESSIKEKS
ncbi:EthD domain-containing protein [Luminiphilus syltensis]|uniref:EthD domain-containing protein n=1 Tax=Luminiphilus syltensis TaxID=1341119 RepID=UPI0002DEE5C2|nr:EthD domain-containing protein [Luminiphilus syltensis]